MKSLGKGAAYSLYVKIIVAAVLNIDSLEQGRTIRRLVTIVSTMHDVAHTNGGGIKNGSDSGYVLKFVTKLSGGLIIGYERRRGGKDDSIDQVRMIYKNQ